MTDLQIKFCIMGVHHIIDYKFSEMCYCNLNQLETIDSNYLFIAPNLIIYG